MSATRLPTHLIVSALLRRVNDAGGLGVVRASGDAQAGTLLILLDEGMRMRAVERIRGLDDRDVLVAAGPATGEERAMEEYWRARRSRDPDLWVIELNVPQAERFVAETILSD